MSWDAKQFATARGTFGIRTAGEPGQPLVLCLHGFLDDASTFDDLLNWCGGHGFHAVAPYLRGHDPSPLSFDNVKGGVVSELRRDLFALCDAISPREPVSLVSHGAGTVVALDALCVAPERFQRAVVLGVPHIALPWFGRWSLRHSGVAGAERIWRHWSNGGAFPGDHWPRVRSTLTSSSTVSVLPAG